MHRATLEHLIRAPLDAVERALLGTETLAELAAALPDVSTAEEIEREVEGSPHATVRRSARYVARATPPGSSRVLSEPRLAWIEEVEWDLRAHEGTFRILPNLRPHRAALFACGGTYALREADGGTRRTVVIEIAIHVRVVGPVVERLVLQTLEPHFAIEAAVLERIAREARG